MSHTLAAKSFWPVGFKWWPRCLEERRLAWTFTRLLSISSPTSRRHKTFSKPRADNSAKTKLPRQSSLGSWSPRSRNMKTFTDWVTVSNAYLQMTGKTGRLLFPWLAMEATGEENDPRTTSERVSGTQQFKANVWRETYASTALMPNERSSHAVITFLSRGFLVGFYPYVSTRPPLSQFC